MNKCKCSCFEDNKNWGCGKAHSNQWGGCQQKNKYEEKKQDNKFNCFCCECEKKQEENKYCGCEQNNFGKENFCGNMNGGFGYSDYGYGCDQKGYGYDNFYSQGY